MTRRADREAQRVANEAARKTQAWVDENARLVCCDFCARVMPDTGTMFTAVGRLRTDVDMLDENLGAGSVRIVHEDGWLACPTCAPVVARQDPGELADYVLEHRDTSRVGHIPKEGLALVRASLLDLYGVLLSKPLEQTPWQR